MRAQRARGGLAPHAVLGLPPEPSKAAVVAAFQRLILRFRPARYEVGSQVRGETTHALHELRAAYDALLTGAAETVLSMPRLAQGSTPELRPIGASASAAPTLEEATALRLALALIRERAWGAAAAVLEPVVVGCPATARSVAYLYLVQGHLADEAGRGDLAVAAWRNALSCDDTLSAARNALAMHAARGSR